ncbi:MAG: DAK2 domain-containing protein [Lachnospiraceae bacterium]|nr:DAK2 domain-containing protein [Lachnospiraceae bacterium]
MFLAGVANLSVNKEWINELNVFPVPDGDTGTNMTLTVMTAAKVLVDAPDSASITDIGKIIATGTLKGARGNSGVIMSQLCRGFTKETEGASKLDKRTIASAMDRAVNSAYKAVMKPKEGTILTVAKAGAAKAAELMSEDISMEEYFSEIIAYSEFILEKTPDMLPVLKEAGVVDSGGQGLVMFLKGAFEAYKGNELKLDLSSGHAETSAAPKGIDTSNISTADIKFGYCTEFLVNLEKPYTDKDEQEFKAFLNSIGDSIVCVHMDDIIKVHVHTNHPGQAFEKGLTYGSLTSMKVDNMREEHNEKLVTEEEKRVAAAEDSAMKSEAAEVAATVAKAEPAGPHKDVGFVAVCAGDGLSKIFKDLSVDAVIEGGQTMNPSTEDIVSAIDTVNADNVFVLPNNGNIIMTAEQAKYLCEGKNIVVIPTKTVTQGITAVINYVPALSVDDNTEHMKKAISEIKSAEITYAIRDTEIDGMAIEVGDYMGIGDGHMLAVSKDMKETTIETIKAMMDEDSEIVTIYYGADVTEDDAQEIADTIEEEYEDAEIDVAYGGQPVYYFIISVE